MHRLAPSTGSFAVETRGRARRPPDADLAPWDPQGWKTADQPPPSPEWHLLSRLTYGPTAAEVERVRTIGLAAYVEEQLAPEAIDDGTLETHQALLFPDLALSGPTLDLMRDSDPPRFARHPFDFKVATLYRQFASRRQLYERMVEFWSDHFHIHHFKGDVRILKTLDDREVIRPHALGSFRQLLNASTRSAAMLLYLDNALNVKAGPQENYSRELMELHSLGVDGGYEHLDVVELARCLTGWNYYRGNRFGEFFFSEAHHDTGEKLVLGERIPAGPPSEQDAQGVIDRLAGHPSTARFIATKLCRRFVADDPPASLVNAVAATFLATDGDVRALLRTIFNSAEFAAASDAKFKRPIDFMHSALRALPVTVSAAGVERLMNDYLGLLGQVPFNWLTPDGLPDTAAVWASTSGFLHRWNMASAICGGEVAGITPRWVPFVRRLNLRTPRHLAHALVARLIQRELTASDLARVVDYAARGEDPDEVRALGVIVERAWGTAALLLASPYFQWR